MISQNFGFLCYRVGSVEAGIDVCLYGIEGNLFSADGTVGGAFIL